MPPRPVSSEKQQRIDIAEQHDEGQKKETNPQISYGRWRQQLDEYITIRMLDYIAQERLIALNLKCQKKTLIPLFGTREEQCLT